ncbi:MAG: Stealth CR1 domain-containing protein [Prevotella sp.]|nr:Stealth CR1 domain-containing protein [Prevotella sp.]
MEKIDFVVPWVDDNDPAWIESYNHYRPEKPKTDSARFRDWGIFRYWFRSVERYAPWVNKVYLITNGTFPQWINPHCEKLVLVKHSDYIPEKYLPTFNSKTIELNLGRIKELSEHFVYFNDDTFINAPITPDYYFREGLPCDYNFESIFRKPSYSADNRFGVDLDMHCDVAVLNSHFSRKATVKQAWKKWYGLHLWGKPLLFSLILLGRSKFETFTLFHHEQPMLKSIFHEIWEKEEAILDESCSRFRKDASLNQYIIRYWQFASNRFYPIKRKGLAYYYYNKAITDDLIKNLHEEQCPSICINDCPYCSEEDLEYAMTHIRQAFEEKFPNVSMYEKEP